MLRFERRRHVAVVVVVAEDREDAVRRVQRRQQLGNGFNERPVAERHIVAAEDDEVRLLRRAPARPRDATSAAGTVPLWWMSVRKPMRRPSSAAGRPDTGSATR